VTQPETAARILQVASTLFAEKGYSNVSVRDICKETNTTPPVIYYYFGSKKGLFDEVARTQITMSAFISKLEDAARTDDSRASLGSFVSTYLSSFPEKAFDPGLYLRDSASLDKLSARRASDDLERIRKVTLKLVRNIMAKGNYSKTDAEMATECLLGMLNRVIFQHIHFAKVRDRESYTRFVTDFFLRAMR
jgi:TetR/AcrR family transcriptional regulator